MNVVTKIQDHVNLDIMGDFRKTDPSCSQDKRWIPVHIVDNANAVILGISDHRFDPEIFNRYGYVKEKLDAIDSKRRMIGV